MYKLVKLNRQAVRIVVLLWFIALSLNFVLQNKVGHTHTHTRTKRTEAHMNIIENIFLNNHKSLSAYFQIQTPLHFPVLQYNYN